MKKSLALVILLLTGASVLFVPMVPANATSSPTITEYPIPTASAFPQDVTKGPDGALWFTESSQSVNKIGRITTSGVITEYQTFFAGPRSIAAGSDGALWYTEARNSIGRISTSGAITEYPIPTLSSIPKGIVAGPDGALWFTESATSKIGRITTAGIITEYTLPVLSNGNGVGPEEITVGPDNALWFTEPGANGIGRITTSGVTTEYSTVYAPNAIAAGSDGAIWVTQFSVKKIGRITLSGEVTEYDVPASFAGPFAITGGPDGSLWFTSGGNIGVDYIGRITTSGVISIYPLPTAQSGPIGITSGPDGALWFAEQAQNVIGRISTLDAIPPLITGLTDRAPNAAGWYNADVIVHWTATDPAPSSGMPTQPVDTIASLEGTNTYTSGQSCDPAGNCATGQMTLKIDKTTPTAGAVGNLTKNVLDPLVLNVAADDQPVGVASGVAGGEYFVGSDPGAGSGTAMTYAGANLSLVAGDNTFVNLAAGVYQLGVRSVDAAGNWSVTSAGQLTVVLPAPAGLSGASPTSNAPMLTWNAVPTASSYRVYRDTGGVKVLAGTVTLPGFTDSYVPGVYSYTVVAVNAAGVPSAESAALQVAVISPTAAHANEAKASGKTEVVPVAGVDLLPGLSGGSQVVGNFDFDLGYMGANNAFQIKNNFTFMYDAGVSHFLVTATSIPWLVVNGAGNTHGTFQGVADVTVGTAAPVSRPFTVEVDAGSKNVGRFKLTVYTDSSRSTVVYRVNEWLEQGKIDIK